jgi:hypothetical protein
MCSGVGFFLQEANTKKNFGYLQLPNTQCAKKISPDFERAMVCISIELVLEKQDKK